MSKNSLTVLAQKLAEKTGISQQDAECAADRGNV